GRSALGEWMEGLAGPHGPVSFWSAYMHLYQHVMPEHKIYDSPSRLALRWGAQQPQNQALSRIRYTALCWIGGAAHPNAGQARSPQGCVFLKFSYLKSRCYFVFDKSWLVCAADWNPVASRLALRWGAQQPQNQALSRIRYTVFPLMGGASHPNAGQARSPQGCGCLKFSALKSTGYFVFDKSWLVCTADWNPVASGLAPRWAAQQPQNQALSRIRYTAFRWSGGASHPNAGQARSPQGCACLKFFL
ncbi:hypothetical protein, partial [Pseudomonas poae]|uniref:hypothetical protein n=1 Tax=Pseudomonas poae TaxID=200451 RepID=UPI001F36B66C